PKVVGLLFKDDLHHPPNPCDRNVLAQIAGSRTSPGLDAHRSTASIGQDASPGGGARPVGSDAAPRIMRRVARAAFPISVPPENPLRVSTRGSLRMDRAGRSAQGFLVDPPLSALSARRVPGVDAMPYERLGIALLPAWNGTTAVRVRNASYYSAAVGTIWAE